MGSNLSVNKEIDEYINNHSLKLNPIQKQIISYNDSLGDIKRMQISISQCHFLHLLIKTSKIKKVLEIGTFTGLSTLTMALALPEDGSIIALDKNKKTNDIAVNFFSKAGQERKIKTIIKPALESLKDLKEIKQKFDFIFIDADKESYIEYFDLCLPLVRKGGIIGADNILFPERFNEMMADYLSHVRSKSNVQSVTIPIDNGEEVTIKISE